MFRRAFEGAFLLRWKRYVKYTAFALLGTNSNGSNLLFGCFIYFPMSYHLHFGVPYEMLFAVIIKQLLLFAKNVLSSMLRQTLSLPFLFANI